jgi:hypothetical protein
MSETAPSNIFDEEMSYAHPIELQKHKPIHGVSL